jgi:hypothetical protein
MKTALNSFAMTLADIADTDNIPRGGNIAVGYVHDRRTNTEHLFFAVSGINNEELYEKHNEYYKTYVQDNRIKVTYCPNLNESILTSFPIERSSDDGARKDSIIPSNIILPEESTTTKGRFKALEAMKKYVTQRLNCTERKILAEIYNQFNVNGKIDFDIELYTIFSTCHECGHLIQSFRHDRMGANYNLKVYDLAKII